MATVQKLRYKGPYEITKYNGKGNYSLFEDVKGVTIGPFNQRNLQQRDNVKDDLNESCNTDIDSDTNVDDDDENVVDDDDKDDDDVDDKNDEDEENDDKGDAEDNDDHIDAHKEDAEDSIFKTQDRFQ
ncbi:uncharacterized protein LOC134717631 [Mytilus trossulus]|uniref:uncharacterized protein LOC134717631 n=1 Tax=Mytilus trossulus TaxID=6551 RepID=UPI0030074EC0